MSFISAIGKHIIPTAKKAVKFAHITDPAQRKAVQTFFAGGENLNKLAQDLEPEMSIQVQKFFKQYERYGFSQGDLKYLTNEEKELLESLEIISDKKMLNGILKRKHLIKDGLLGCVKKDNKKAFAQILNDKTITDEELCYVADLITDENVSVVRKLLKDKNFDRKTFQYLPSTHLTNENIEVLKAISKNGNVDLQEKLYLMVDANKSNSDIAIKLLEKAKNNTNGLNSILGKLRADANMSAEELKEFNLRKNFILELLDKSEFKLGTDKDGLENYLISKVILSVKPENYEIAQTALLKGNANLYRLPDFLKGITSENQSCAKRIINLSSKDTWLPEGINPETASKYLDEVEKINNPKAQSHYIDAMHYGISAENLDETLKIIKTTKPENARRAGAIISCLNHTSANTREIEAVINAIEKSGMDLNYFDISNLVVLSKCSPAAGNFIQRILNNKIIPEEYHFYQIIEKYMGISSKNFDLKTEDKFVEMLEKLFKNKNLNFYEVEDIISKISPENIDIIQKYAHSPKIRDLNKLIDGETESVLSSTISKYQKDILKARKDLPQSQIDTILKHMKNDVMSHEGIMELINNKSIKDEYIIKLLDKKSLEMYQKNPQLASRALDLKMPLRACSLKSCSVPITDLIGEKRFAKMIKGLEDAKSKYNIAPTEELTLYLGEGGDANDLLYVLKQPYGLSYKFDKKTGKLLSIDKDGKVIQVSKSTTIEDNVYTEMATEKAPYRINTVEQGKNGIKETVYTESSVKGQYDIYQTRPDGSRIRIGHAQVTPNGVKHVRRTLRSLDGSKTYTAFREDKAGNSYFHSVITDKTGKQVSEVTRTFKVLSKNHFVSTRNGQAYDILFTNNNVVVTKLDAMGKKTAETVNYTIKDIPVETADRIAGNLKNMTENKGYQQVTRKIFKKFGIEPKTIDRSCVNMLKRLPGDEWLAMNKSCDFVMPQSFEAGNACYSGNSIFMSKECSSNLGIFAHELGHAKFHILDLRKDKELMKIYNAEKRAYTIKFPKSRIGSIDYFLRENNVAKRGLNEACAETNLLSDTIQTCEELQDRSIFLEQYFPNTIAHIRQRYSALA